MIGSVKIEVSVTDANLTIFAVCFSSTQASEDTSKLASDQSGRRREDGDAASSTCGLALAADRLANALFQVLDAFQVKNQQQPLDDPLLNELQKVAKPVATELQKAMACEVQGTPMSPQNSIVISKASL